ncbi:MAG: hypothetical protein V1903_01730 [Bacteroidota bacterium]
MKRILIIKLLIIMIVIPVSAQTGQQDLKREVTLYNPYKPSLAPVRKRSFLPDMNDTSRIKPQFSYDIAIRPFMPEYTISPIKAASLLPDPLPRLYKSYVNMGIGNYITPFAELSITNERSKKGAVGLYARHFSTNGKIKLLNNEKVLAWYMDNDAVFFGKKFFRNSYVEGTVDYSQKLRYAYGYDTLLTGYEADKKDIRLGYNNMGADITFASLTLDSAKFSYNFNAGYDFFFSSGTLYQHNAGLTGTMATLFKGFYAGSDLKLDFFIPSAFIYGDMKYIAALSPFVKKSTSQWNFKAGFEMLLDQNMNDKPAFHFYPDVRFGFSVVPEYVGFFAALNGKLEVNQPKYVIDINPFLINNGSLYNLANTDHSLIVSAGLNGNTGIGGNYLVSASYSMIDSMLFFSNYFSTLMTERGNHFIPLYDDGELLNIHGEITGSITEKVTYSGAGNFYKYTLSNYDHAWNKPAWDGQIGIKYNLRNKILAGFDIIATGKRNLMTTRIATPDDEIILFEEPVHFNFNLSAEYRYTKILSFWLKLNNIAARPYNEWAYYPGQRFMGLIGFTYSL